METKRTGKLPEPTQRPPKQKYYGQVSEAWCREYQRKELGKGLDPWLPWHWPKWLEDRRRGRD